MPLTKETTANQKKAKTLIQTAHINSTLNFYMNDVILCVCLMKNQAHTMRNRLVQISDFQQNVSTATREQFCREKKKLKNLPAKMHVSFWYYFLVHAIHITVAGARPGSCIPKQQHGNLFFSIIFSLSLSRT